MRLETERLILRPFRDGDAEDLYEYLKDPEMHCFADMKITSVEHAKRELEHRKEDEGYFAVELKETGKVIGEYFVHAEPTLPDDPNPDTYSPCWMLNPAYKGKGYGFEAAKVFIDYLFKDLNARRVYMYTEDNNIACQRLCEKLGARQEGLFKEFVTFVNDEDGNPIYENTYQYAILRREWQY